MTYKEELLHHCMKSVIDHAFRNKKYTLELESQYEVIMMFGSPIQKQLVQDIMTNRGLFQKI
jgi:hypothetical protein